MKSFTEFLNKYDQIKYSEFMKYFSIRDCDRFILINQLDGIIKGTKLHDYVESFQNSLFAVCDPENSEEWTQLRVFTIKEFGFDYVLSAQRVQLDTCGLNIDINITKIPSLPVKINLSLYSHFKPPEYIDISEQEFELTDEWTGNIYIIGQGINTSESIKVPQNQWNHPEFIESIKDFIGEHLILIVMKNPESISTIKHPSKEIQEYVLSRRPDLIGKIQNLDKQLEKKYKTSKFGSEAGFF